MYLTIIITANCAIATILNVFLPAKQAGIYREGVFHQYCPVLGVLVIIITVNGLVCPGTPYRNWRDKEKLWACHVW